MVWIANPNQQGEYLLIAFYLMANHIEQKNIKPSLKKSDYKSSGK
jgi:hypothetical protein